MEYNFCNVLLILHVKYFYNRLRFKFVIDKSCRGGHFFHAHSLSVGFMTNKYLLACKKINFSNPKCSPGITTYNNHKKLADKAKKKRVKFDLCSPRCGASRPVHSTGMLSYLSKLMPFNVVSKTCSSSSGGGGGMYGGIFGLSSMPPSPSWLIL